MANPTHGPGETVEPPGPSTPPFDPKEKMDDMDWQGLVHNFDTDMEKLNAKEVALYDEMEDLVAFFKVWAETMHHYDTERARKRLKTRVAKVQDTESKLEEKRLHYVKVVEAFQSALRLLNI